MQNLNTKNQNPNKIHTIPGYHIGSFLCYNAKDDEQGIPAVNIQLTSLEEMWYGHEENIDHPADSEYPKSINVPHMRVMRDRVIDSVLNRTGIDISKFDSIIHASTSPGRNPDGTIMDQYAGTSANIIRNV